MLDTSDYLYKVIQVFWDFKHLGTGYFPGDKSVNYSSLMTHFLARVASSLIEKTTAVVEGDYAAGCNVQICSHVEFSQ